MKICIYSKVVKEQDIPFFEHLFDALHEEQVEYILFQPIVDQLKNKFKIADRGTFNDHEDLKNEKPDFFITMGGDGTILQAITLIQDLGIPVLGINLGRMGFLANIDKRFIKDAILNLKNNIYSIEARRMIHLDSNIPIFGETKFALNDCTLLKRDTSSMVVIHTYINGDFLNSYWADGIIIATPTGSTGYSLSCGGPIIFPKSGNFVITPVAPHNLNVRPIVISDDTVISFEMEGRAENFLCTLDSRYETISKKHQIAIRKCNFDTKLVRLPDNSFLQTIRDKLAWGIDTRN